MISIADQLPPEIARQINADCRKNEATYWAMRDQLLGQYQNQWIGFADGAVIACGTSPVAVFHAAEATGRNPYVTCVGLENEPTRMRRINFAYDGSYPGEPLPILILEFRTVSGMPGVTLDRVVADTDADASALPWAVKDSNSPLPKDGQVGWGVLQAELHQPFTSVSGSTWMDKSIRADCKRISSGMNASWGATF